MKNYNALMDTVGTINQQLEALKCCILVPTYNNIGSIGKVLDDLLAITPHVIVVNDGSTDGSELIISSFTLAGKVFYEENRGKGFALRTGFKKALELGYDNAITIDADGQHLATDLVHFLASAKLHPGALIVGARRMPETNVPRKNSFANRFSNFWFTLETGIRLPDTQSGYRLYPISKFRRTIFFTNKYEFELEILVRSAWRGIVIISIPVNVYYPPISERVSHFRPFRDFTRISLLNTVLVVLALLVFRPWLAYIKIRREGLWKIIRKEFLRESESNLKMALSIGLGLFCGIAPVWGWQMVVAYSLASLLKLNRLITLVAANISLPPFIPFILYLSLVAGKLLTGNPQPLKVDIPESFSELTHDLGVYLAGSITLGLAAALVGGVVSYLLFRWLRKTKELT